MFRQIATSAVFAGFCAGLIAAALQLMFVQPVLLHAELYESGVLSHFGAAPVSANPDLPGIDLMRDGLSVLFTALIYTGYAFLLVGLMALAAQRGAVIDGRTGVLWGLAGFACLHFAPAFGLPPEVPGVAAADLGARQLWWFSTVAATALALWLFAFGKGPMVKGLAALVLIAPHLVGAPHPDSFTGPVPPELAALFASRALGVGLVSWVLLGWLAGYFWQREAEAAHAPRTA